MIRVILKNTGRILILLAVLTAALPLSAADIETEISSSRIHEGETAVLKLMISNSTSDIKPLKVPGINGLNISFRGSTRSFQFINGKSWSGTILNFSIYGEKKGRYTIPPFVLEADGERLVSKEIGLTVLAGSGGAASSRDEQDGSRVSLRGGVEFASDTVSVGEPLIVRYFLYHGGTRDFEIEGIRNNPESRGFLVKKINEEIPDSETMQGDAAFIRTHVATYCFIPAEPGSFFPGGGSIVVSQEIIRGPFTMPGRREIMFPKKAVKVTALPGKGRPSEFRGDVGDFTVEVKVPETGVRLYDEVRIPVKVSGSGNLFTLSKPVPEKNEPVKVIVEDVNSSVRAEGEVLTGEKNYLLTLIPDRSGEIDLGPVSISAYNPGTKKYETASSAPIVLNVVGTGQDSRAGEVEFDKSEDSMSFSIPLIVGIIIAVAGAVVSIVLWERKKYRVVVHHNSKPVEKDEEKDSAEKRKELILSMTRAIDEGNDDSFLRFADMALKHVDEKNISSNIKDEIHQIKDRIYTCRYGGGRPGDDELSRIRNVLTKVLKG